MTMPTYRRRTDTTVVAVRWMDTPESVEAMKAIVTGWPLHPFYMKRKDHRPFVPSRKPGFLLVRTLNGRVKMAVGDYLVRGPAGEFFPMNPATFDHIYTTV